ncbi:MAG: hypothetical protein ONB24_12485 [candidate division KSB1 bacterium]|nr:hypothetical protein [candidate division KSB1 bacterium]
MKLLFSEYKSDYAHYIFPYVIWAFPEEGETPADLFAAGFLPSTRTLDRFYMCRHVRVALPLFSPSSENRRVLRKGEGLQCALLPRADFHYTSERREFCKSYADRRFGPDTMTYERLDSLFTSPVCTHVMLFREGEKEVGLTVLFLQPPRAAFYYYAFYDLEMKSRNLGMYMMTRAVVEFAAQGFQHIYLGSCYSRNALYKTQFEGFEFWNGFRWSSDLEELKYLIERDAGEIDKHLLENPAFADRFYPQGWGSWSGKLSR